MNVVGMDCILTDNNCVGFDDESVFSGPAAGNIAWSEVLVGQNNMCVSLN